MGWHWTKRILDFNTPVGTSRGVMSRKPSWFIQHSEHNLWIGECGVLPSLSTDSLTEIEPILTALCIALNSGEPLPDLSRYPAIRCGLSAAMLAAKGGGLARLWPSDFALGKAGIETNGLIWMNTIEAMKAEARAKEEAGYQCIKVKVGAHDFDSELQFLRWFRREFGHRPVLRLDANGAFSPHDALEKLRILSQFEVHSIEQPIKAGQLTEMAALCAESPIAVALDEELIGCLSLLQLQERIAGLNPPWVVLKPSLLGEFEMLEQLIGWLQNRGVGFWFTSALESNVGLMAIAQFTAVHAAAGFPQGLGTGSLYSNNIPSPLYLHPPFLSYDPHGTWIF